VRINDAELSVLSAAVVGALLKQGFVKSKVDEKSLVQRITRLFVDNLRTEAEIEEEAERLAEKHSRQMQGMDHRKVVLGIKQRIAKERNFAL
jgi:hypothetical protein